MSPAPLILASASPRRQQLLQQLGVEFTVKQQDIDESCRPLETPMEYVQRMAQEKAASALAGMDGAIVIGADTIVVLNGNVLGKPTDELDARRMLTQLSGRVHEVFSAVAVCSAEHSAYSVSVSKVHFRVITPLEMAAYWQTGEPQGKAGGYAIQGLAAIFIEQLQGSYSGVMGLPLYETAQLLSKFSIAVLPMQAEQ